MFTANGKRRFVPQDLVSIYLSFIIYFKLSMQMQVVSWKVHLKELERFNLLIFLI